MGNAPRTPARLPRNTRNAVHDAENEGGHSPAENARLPENARQRGHRRPTAREELAALIDPPSAPTFADSPRLAELLARHALGMIEPRAAARLAEIFRDDPPDALERLERAADHLAVTGDHADDLTARSAALALEEQGHAPAPAHPLAGAPANRPTASTPAGNTDCATSKGQA